MPVIDIDIDTKQCPAIGNGAFGKCNKLTTIFVRRAEPDLTSIGSFDCNWIRKIFVPSAKLNGYKSLPNWSKYSDRMLPAADITVGSELNANGEVVVRADLSVCTPATKNCRGIDAGSCTLDFVLKGDISVRRNERTEEHRIGDEAVRQSFEKLREQDRIELQTLFPFVLCREDTKPPVVIFARPGG